MAAGPTRKGRISRSGDFQRAYRAGRSRASRFLVVYAFVRPEASDASEARLGVSVGRKVGGAVERNRVKRVLREAFSSLAPELPASHDFVVVARPEIVERLEREGSGWVAAELSELSGAAAKVG